MVHSVLSLLTNSTTKNDFLINLLRGFCANFPVK